MAYGDLIASDPPAVTPAADRGLERRFSRNAKVRGRLFRKYVGLFVAVVSLALFANGVFEIWFSYQEHKAALIRIQREQAEAAAAKIGQFVKEIEGQLGWTVQLPWSASTLEQRRFDALRLLRQVPAITELAQLDFDRQGAAARLAPRHGRSWQRTRFVEGPEIHRSGRRRRSITARSISAASPSPT